MQYLKPDIDFTKVLISSLKDKRLSQLRAFYTLRKATPNVNPLKNIDKLVEEAYPFSLTPVWSWWLNEQMKNNFEIKVTSNKVFGCANTGDISSLVNSLMEWTDFNDVFQLACPEGYVVDNLNLNDKWKQVLNNSLQIISGSYPLLFAEMKMILKAVIPLKPINSAHPAFSFSAQNRQGAIFLTYHENPRIVVDNLIHEYYHNRLNLLLCSDAIILNSSDEYYSIWRKIKRPLLGIFHGTYASFGIAHFWHKYINSGQSYFSYLENNVITKEIIKMAVALKFGTQMIVKHGKPTLYGRQVIKDLVFQSEAIFDWACKSDSTSVGKYYTEYKLGFDNWGAKNNIHGEVFASIF